MKKRQKLIDLFVNWNGKINLSAIRKPDDIYVKHILDSLELNKVWEFEIGKKVLDIGTWWGFPLLPLAVSNPKINFTWIDSTRKKVMVVNDIIEKLWLRNAKAIWGRSEEYQEKFDYIIARAVGYSTKLIPQVLHLIKKRWIIILYKQSSEEERKDIVKLCKKNNLIILKEHYYSLFDWDIERKIYFLKNIIAK